MSVLVLNNGSLSHIFTFLDVKKILSLRLVWKKFDKAVWYGWKIRVNELRTESQELEQFIAERFDGKILTQHTELKDRNHEILGKLEEYEEEMKKPTLLLPNLQNIGFLVKPCRFLSLPCIVCLVLLGWKMPTPHKWDFNSREDFKKIWKFAKIEFKNRNFHKFKYLPEFKIDSISPMSITIAK